MIVYNVERGWFPMKNDADAHRRQLGLKPAALATIRIDTREELAALLNGLMGLKKDPELTAPEEIAPAGAVLEPQVVEPEVIERNRIEVPDCVPMFLVRDWTKRNDVNMDDVSLVSSESSPGS
ncbi:MULTISPECIES: hypothetical protein [unclassified Mesorhizobium]|uniref:hypothetical protein n=1 Tax=unclassified Mesorhizobium TaxID=325217 RepID=UPI00112CA42B|nr:MULTISPECIES: hypothetical protein [unclassified Mesorhizobium]TPL42566.1 hypothetical protein FJ961_07705 [Mesorhizobium sp. B2-4-5]TPL66566.1 hypothetical protein FJ949_09365 [Mesorhizobium sp. B2-4-1]